ncbi:MAG: T9SS type A sorting domain-containing protein [Candidatus Stahlbacteria bacterium]|nr:T9SS type A sorting domain-containing protein [Candidatus Stahlbacteria bacterium]
MSKYNKGFWVIGLLVGGNCLFAAAPDTAWTRRFDELVGTAVSQTRDGGYIISSYGYKLLKTDSLGNKEWLKVISEVGSYNHSIWQTQDGGYVVTGGGLVATGYQDSSIVLIKTDAQGDVEWNKIFEERSSGGGQCAQQTQDGGYIITGDKNQEDSLVLIKTDSLGNKEWGKSFSRDNAGIVLGCWVQQSHDKGYIITGRIYFDSSGYKGWLIKTDSLGNKEWDKTFGEGLGNCVQQTQDKGFIIVEHRLLKTDLLGNKEWDKSFGIEGYSVQQVADSGYFIVGRWGFADGIAIIRTDVSGDTLWTKIMRSSISTNSWEIGYSGQPTSDGGYIIIGESSPTRYNGFPYSLGTWLIKIEPETGIEDRSQKTEDRLEVYPNPSGKSATIRYSVQNTQDISIQVYDAAGRIVETLVSEKKEPGSYHIDFNFNGRKGIYFVELEAVPINRDFGSASTGNYKETKKLVLMK